MKKIVNVNGSTYGDRELSQLIRRNMMSKTYKSKKDYTRKIKHKNEFV
jgi:hypothetical protein